MDLHVVGVIIFVTVGKYMIIGFIVIAAFCSTASFAQTRKAPVTQTHKAPIKSHPLAKTPTASVPKKQVKPIDPRLVHARQKLTTAEKKVIVERIMTVNNGEQ